MTKSAVWTREQVAYVEEDTRVVVLRLGRPAGARPEVLTDAGAIVWRLLGTTGLTTEQLLARIQREEPAPAPSLADLAEILTALRERGYVSDNSTS